MPDCQTLHESESDGNENASESDGSESDSESGVSVPTPGEAVYRTPEVKLKHTWAISGPDLDKAIAQRPPPRVSSEVLEHKAFPGLKWQLELRPLGNSQDSEHKPGFASLYLRAYFGSNHDDPQAVYAKWTAVVTFKEDGKDVIVPPVSAQFNVYSPATGAKFGFANAFPWPQSNSGTKGANSTSPSLDIQLELTIASIPEMLKCHGLLSSLHSDKIHADVDINVDGKIHADVDINVDGKIHADVDIDVAGTPFKAHKFLLAARSSFFAGMFESAMKEKQTGTVDVKDTTPEAFTAFKGAIYCKFWDFLADADATMDVLVLAEKYGVADLKRYCDDALAHFVDKDNVFNILSHAAMHNATATKAACVKILVADDLLASKGWADFKENNENIAFDVVEATGDYFRTLQH